MAITFQNRDIRFVLFQKRKIRAWLQAVIRYEQKNPGEINFQFTNDEQVLEYNKRFLKHNTYTDIITFHSNSGNTVNGDILISVNRVKENAVLFGVTFEQELKRVMVHGVLHLCGYKDKKPSDVSRMRRKENKALSLYREMDA